MNYELNIEKLATWLLRPLFRKPKMLSMVKVLITPLVTLYDNFLLEGGVMLQKARVTAQTGQLEGLLNDSFDPERRSVRIVHAASHQTIISNARPLVLSDIKPTIIQGNTIGLAEDFYIKLPLSIVASYQTIVRGELDKAQPLVLSNTSQKIFSNTTQTIVRGKLDKAQPLVLSNNTSLTINALSDVGDVSQITALVNKHKLAGKKFSFNI